MKSEVIAQIPLVKGEIFSQSPSKDDLSAFIIANKKKAGLKKQIVTKASLRESNRSESIDPVNSQVDDQSDDYEIKRKKSVEHNKPNRKLEEQNTKPTQQKALLQMMKNLCEDVDHTMTNYTKQTN